MRDLAVLRADRPLAASVPGLVAVAAVKPAEMMAVQGVSEFENDRPFAVSATTGVWQGSALREDGVAVGQMDAAGLVLGMSGGPVRRISDGMVAGVVSARYIPAAGSSRLRDAVWVARADDLRVLLADVADVRLRQAPAGELVEVTVTVSDTEVSVVGGGRSESRAHDGVPVALKMAWEALTRARAGLGGQRHVAADTGIAGPVQAATAEVGRLLTEAFFAEGPGRLLARILEDARSAHRPVLIGLRVPGPLAALPWETVRPSGSERPLALDPLVRVFRQVDAAGSPPSLPGPLRILVAIASPLAGGGQVLGYERELRNVLTAVRAARADAADVRVVPFATTAEIRAALERYPAHVLHLSGHGGPGRLELEDAEGNARSVTAAELIDEAVPAGRMPVVFGLAACHTGRESAAGDPSFAAGLIARGAGVVIGTETSISDGYATTLFARIYGRLAASSAAGQAADVVTAVAEARIEVQQTLTGSGDVRRQTLAGLQEWATVSVTAPAGTVPLIDTGRPPEPLPPVERAGVLRREVGEVVGRRREQRLWPAELLQDARAGLVIHGLGGVGKTTLADELVARVREREPERIPVVVTGQISGESLLASLTTPLAEALRGTPATHPVWTVLARVAATEQPLAVRMTALLEALLPAVPVLLVLDNFEDNLDGTGQRPVHDPSLAAVLSAIATQPGRCRMLITSRYRFTLPGRAHRLLAFHQLGPLSLAETLKLVWVLPALDRLAPADIEQVWRAVGGHPRCLEYLDALLAKGTARYTDVTTRLLAGVETRLRTAGTADDADVTDEAIDDYLSAHSTLDTALAEAATLAADDILLDQLLTALADTPDAARLLLGASVYRHPVGHAALAFQLGRPDPTIEPAAHIPGIDQQISELLTSAGVDLTQPLDVDGLSAMVRMGLDQLLDQRLPVPPVRVEADLGTLLRRCADASLITVIDPRKAGGGPHVFVHRWTATELTRRAIGDHRQKDLATAHRNAAAYWQWCVDHWPQPPAADADDLREAHHHLHIANTLTTAPDHDTIATTAQRLQYLLGQLGQRHEAATYAHEHLTHRRHLHTLQPTPQRTADLAGALNDLGIRLSALGRREEALAATEEAVEVNRRLAAANPAAFEPDLAASLNNLGADLSGLGRREEALAATEEAVEVRRRLAAANPAAFEPDLAASLNNLGADLSGLGRREEALAATEEAVEVRRRLAAANPAAFEPDLAGSLNNLGIRLSGLGRREEALAATEEAVEVYRRLAAANPAAFEPDLAGSLTNLGIRLSGLGRREEALAATDEAVEVRRRLAAANPAAFEPDLAASLNNLGAMLSELGRREEALAATEEAVEVRRRLAAANPAAFEPDLARSLTNLGAMLSALGRREEALAATEEAVEVYRRLAAANPAAFEPHLAASLNNLGAMLSELGRREEALAATEEAVEVRRRLAAANPAAFEPHLAGSLTNLGADLSALGRREEALAATEEAVEVYRRLAAANPAAFEPDLARSLNNLGNGLSALGRREEALAATEEAVEVYRRLAAANPAAFEPNLARSLWAFAWVCVKSKANWIEARELVTEAINLYERLIQRFPQTFAGELLSAYRTLADVLDGLGQADEAADLRRQLNKAAGGSSPDRTD
ncbi:tetratricopeptide (TPR) repeat protein [Catenuloplanes atrovinosus]|uniref:Tetratricopeptide (TPR) repeat protein n=2 Tax=Catenuloplanes atrovinosus TaxID=137266 RepID=A0AAE4CCR0_9ACTN|nr:tetratricopeptide (TPR) repeat protein [Catenuloplanes atrovinosus]